MLEAWIVGFVHKGLDLGLEAGVRALKIGFEPQGWNLCLKGGRRMNE